MNTDSNTSRNTVGEIDQHELAALRNDWWCLLLLGIALVVGGTAAVAYPWFTSIGVVILIGAVLIVSGVAIIVSACWAGRWSALMVQVLIGLLYLVAGIAIIDAPIESARLFTLMFAGFFVIAGAFRIVTALVEKYTQWGWSLVNGIATLLVGLIIFRSFRKFPEEPEKILWVIGLLVGIELLFNGWTWIMLAIAVKNLPAPEESTT